MRKITNLPVRSTSRPPLFAQLHHKFRGFRRRHGLTRRMGNVTVAAQHMRLHVAPLLHEIPILTLAQHGVFHRGGKGGLYVNSRMPVRT